MMIGTINLAIGTSSPDSSDRWRNQGPLVGFSVSTGCLELIDWFVFHLDSRLICLTQRLLTQR